MQSWVKSVTEVTRRGGVATFAGKNDSRSASHFPWNSLMPFISGSAVFALFLFTPFMALKAFSPFASLSLFSQYSHWRCLIAFLQRFAACLLWAFFSSFPRCCQAHLFAVCNWCFNVEISLFHHGLDFCPGLDHGTASSRALLIGRLSSYAARRVDSAEHKFDGLCVAMILLKAVQSVLWCMRLREKLGGVMVSLVSISGWSESPPPPGSQFQLSHRSNIFSAANVRSIIVGRASSFLGKCMKVPGVFRTPKLFFWVQLVRVCASRDVPRMDYWYSGA